MKWVLLFLLMLHPLQATTAWPKYKIEQTNLKSGRLSNSIVRLIESKYGLKCIGTGFAMYGGPIRMFCFSFLATGPRSHSAARDLMVLCIEDMVNLVKSDSDIHPFLFEKSIDQTNFSVKIFFRDCNGNCIAEPDIGVVSLSMHDIYYDFFALEAVGGPSIRHIKEPFKEAVEIVRNKSTFIGQ